MQPQPRYQPGDYIDDRYQVRRVLMGGMGEVYVAWDIALEQMVALKTFQARYFSNKRAVNLFLSEAKTWILLERHPHIVQATSTFLVDQQPFLVIEYVDGGNLRSRLRKGPLDVPTALDLAIQFSAGAQYASRKLGLIHRDIKPDNLLITKSGTLKIADFGLSRIDGLVGEQRGVMGTPPYMSPEQWVDVGFVTKQSDIYSFGVVLYEMVTGERPFRGTISELRRAHQESTAPDPRKINPKISDRLSKIISSCLAKPHFLRFRSYEDLVKQLKQVYRVHTGQEYARRVNKDGDDDVLGSQAELLNNGDALFSIGRHSEALRYYDRLLELDPNSAKFWQRKGKVLARLGKYHEAELYFSKALEIEPSNLEAVKGKTKCLLVTGKREEADACCSPALAMNPSDRDLLRLKQELLAMTYEPQEGVTKQQPEPDVEIIPPSVSSPLIKAWFNLDDQLSGLPNLFNQDSLLPERGPLPTEGLPHLDDVDPKRQHSFDQRFLALAAQLQKQNMALEITPLAKKFCCTSYNHDEGRSPKQAFSELIEEPLTDKLLMDEFQAGDLVRVDRKFEKIVFEKMKK